MGWMVNATPRPLYPKERHPVPNYIGGWVVPRAGLDGCEKCRPHRDSIRPARSESPYRLRYPYATEKKVTENKNACFDSFKPLSETLFILRRTERDKMKNVY
jgi:hypothetical protein